MSDPTFPPRSALLAAWDDEPTPAQAVLGAQAPAFNPTPAEYKELYGRAMPKPVRPKVGSESAPPAPKGSRKPGQRLTEEQEHYVLTAPGSLNKKALALGIPRQTLQSVVRRAREIQEGVNITHRCRRCQELLVCPTCGGKHG